MTATFTHTYTKARIQVITSEYTFLLLHAGLTDDEAESFAEGVRRRMLQSVTIYTTDSAGSTHAEVMLAVDWDVHDRFMAKGTVTVSIDRDLWKEDVSPDIRLAVRTFRQFVARAELQVGVEVELTPEVLADPAKEAEADALMNLVPATPRPWAAEPESFGGEVEEVPELRVDTRLSDPG